MSNPKVMYEGKYLLFMNEEGWEYVQRKNCSGIVIILALTPQDEVVFIEQFRMAVGKQSIELPAGLVGDREHAKEESMETAALRELEEEAGYRAGRIEPILEMPANVGISRNMILFLQAYDLTKVSEGGGDHEEDIQVRTVPLSQADDWLREQYESGKVIDPKVYAGLYFLKLRKKT